MKRRAAKALRAGLAPVQRESGMALASGTGPSGYQAAKRELAALRNFVARPRTADEDALPGLPELRARSREMMMNAPLASGAVKTVVTNVVGTGLRLSAQVNRHILASIGISAEAAEEYEHALEAEWQLFCRRENADHAQRLCFEEMQELAFRSVLGSGDCFVAAVARPAGADFDFALQLIEADRVSNPSRKASTETLADGIEYTDAGVPVACHVAELPRTGTGARNWRRLPLRAVDGSPRVLHLMHGERIGQSRGVPYLAPVVATLKDLDRYSQAELTAAVLNACIAILGESPKGDSPLKAGADAGGGGLRRADINFESGMVLEGFMPGETLKSFAPDRPSQGFDPFVLAVLRQVGVALELPFELLVKHFTASYSAARAALLQAAGFFKARRVWLARNMCQPSYELVVRNAVLRGTLVLPGFLEDSRLRMAWLGTRWTGDSFGQINPEIEVRAAERRIRLGLSSRTRETAELTGENWEAVVAEAAAEAALLRELGLPQGDALDDAPVPDMPMDGDLENAAQPRQGG